MKIIGLDPGYDRLGWGILEASRRNFKVVDFGIIQTKKQHSIFERYSQILSNLERILRQHNPQEAAVETLFFSKNQKTAMRVSEARGLIIGQLLHCSCQVFEYSPQDVKLAVTGYGKADKQAVEKMVRAELNLGSKKIIDDTLDALAVALTHGLSTSNGLSV